MEKKKYSKRVIDALESIRNAVDGVCFPDEIDTGCERTIDGTIDIPGLTDAVVDLRDVMVSVAMARDAEAIRAYRAIKEQRKKVQYEQWADRVRKQGKEPDTHHRDYKAHEELCRMLEEHISAMETESPEIFVVEPQFDFNRYVLMLTDLGGPRELRSMIMVDGTDRLDIYAELGRHRGTSCEAVFDLKQFFPIGSDADDDDSHSLSVKRRKMCEPKRRKT